MFKKEIKRGAKLLDVARPGWDKNINLEMLDMGDSEFCILGQLYGDFDIGAASFHIDSHMSDEDVDFGFNSYHFRWLLTREWVALIKERLAA